ncbi:MULTISPECIES: tyrosine-type recombinase/integrase [Pelistega]|uniref:tyrosine-type recombinase/integrase n=1 Tax=Pelistega TaxID=106146 RepID=UPI000401CF0E|nr:MULTISPECIES: tyrosine-type recombinase/integrase [Pelistega]
MKTEGKDPALEKKEKKQAQQAQEQNTFEKYCWLWFEMRSKRLSEKYAHDLQHQIKRLIIPALGHIPIEKITPPTVMNLLNDLSNKGLGDTTRRTLQRINAIMNYAVQIGALSINPILSLTGIVVIPPTKHQLALREDELTEFFKRLITVNARAQTKIAMLITILTFVRVGSLRQVEWKEIDFDQKTWTIPAEKFKGGAMSLIVPLSDWVLSLFRELRTLDKQETGYIFYNCYDSTKYMSENALSYLMGRMGYHGIATPHGFRSLATDILNEKSNFSPDIIERQLGHIERNSVRRAYHRTEYMPARIEMMEWYSLYIRKYYDEACHLKKPIL